jgi:hypothetical protein
MSYLHWSFFGDHTLSLFWWLLSLDVYCRRPPLFRDDGAADLPGRGVDNAAVEEEQRTGTLEMLLTLPVSTVHLVLGKFLEVVRWSPLPWL